MLVRLAQPELDDSNFIIWLMIMTSLFWGMERVLAKKFFSKILLFDTNNIENNPYTALTAFEEIISLLENTLKKDNESELKLLGLLEEHVKNCRDVNCPCKVDVH